MSEKAHYLHLPSSAAAYVCACLALGAENTKDAALLRMPDTSGRGISRTVVIIVPDTQTGEMLTHDLRFFLSAQTKQAQRQLCPAVTNFFGWEILPFDLLSPADTVTALRLQALYALTNQQPFVLVATIDALMQRLVPPRTLRESVFHLELDKPLDRDDLIAVMERGGYSRSSLVEECGQYAVRGAVVDFFPPGSLNPLRVELFDDRVESLRFFDAATQRSSGVLRQFSVLPVKETFWLCSTASGTEGGANKQALFLTQAINSLRHRASELSIPQAAVRNLEDALQENMPWPGLEHLQPLFGVELASFWDYLPAGSVVAAWDAAQLRRAAGDFEQLIQERAKKALEEGRIFPEPASAYLSAASVCETLNAHAGICFDHLTVLTATGGDAAEESAAHGGAEADELEPGLSVNAVLNAQLRLARYKERPFKPLADQIKRDWSNGILPAIAVSHAQRMRRIEDLLGSYDIPSAEYHGDFFSWAAGADGRRKAQEVSLLLGALSSGFASGASGFRLIADRELFPEITPRRESVSARNVRRFLGTAAQLHEHDYVVHIEYGIGIYRGLKVLSVDGRAGDFLELEYAEGAKLFVPVENIGKVQKYSAAEGRKPALTRLGGKTWEKTKKKVKENVAELAGQLLNVMAAREVRRGVSFGPPTAEDRDFADAFAFEETPDQAAAIEAVLGDLAKPHPMDRLVCGDVGYGKTEVALRAAFRVACAGAQTAVLVPTTVLAEQHYATFNERFAGTPVAVGCVSRFYSSAQNKETLSQAAAGKLDVVIGTHRLLQRDVQFKNLGLVVIDEEHRFGVAHKEKLKRMRAEVDVLTLTATPIPRTLHMSLTGIRDLSLIETAPCNRQVIRTYVANYEASIVREAILRELGRSGQVFFIHNRVQNIAQIAQEVQDLVPQARIAFAHGQMHERELERVMHRFISREIDVLVSTTIIESGLDIANANTIIIRDSDMFGLAELYQLRGRVGRSSRRAYAYLLVSDAKKLGPEAKKRLEVLQSLDDLGVGFRLALQDMEIRGAGNLLGKDQSGHIHLVGFELYSRILKDAVGELRRRERRASLPESLSEPARPDVDPEMHIGFPAHIPEDYVPDISERLLLYQRLTQLEGEDEAREMAEEIEDRFGAMPDDVEVLLELMLFRSVLRCAGIVVAAYRGGSFSFKFHPEAAIDAERVTQAVRSGTFGLRLSPALVFSFPIAAAEVAGPQTFKERLVPVLDELGCKCF